MRVEHRVAAVLQARAEEPRHAVEGVGDVAGAREGEFLNERGRRDGLPYPEVFVTESPRRGNNVRQSADVVIDVTLNPRRGVGLLKS